MTKSIESHPGRAIVPNIILLPEQTVTETGTAEPVTVEGYSTLTLSLDVTATADDPADTLDVFIQTTIDGTNWVDCVHFSQIAGDDGPKRYMAKIVFTAALTEFENGAALAAGAVRALFGDQWRVRWDVVNDTAPSFTFGIKLTGT